MKRSLVRILMSTIVIATLGVALLSVSNRASAPKGPNVAMAASAQWQYCVDNGGLPLKRLPAYGTNDPNPLILSGSQVFCQFTSSDTSRIHILVDTLYSTKPTLAALAYYAQEQPGTCQGNPASCYCTLLGGSDQFGGIGLAGGGWVSHDSVDHSLEACIFPDMSSIDSWGLFYYSAGIVRGTDLSKILRYPNPYAKTKKP
jgi:putative hemolysin